MGSMRRVFVAVFVLAGLSVAVAALHARADEPCMWFGLKGGEVLEIPCPRDLAEALELPLFRQPPRDESDFAIIPDIPDDRDMVIDPEWPHDRGIVAEPDGDRPPEAIRGGARY